MPAPGDARQRLADAYRTILECVLGCDGALSEGMLRTPERCADAMLSLTRGYDQDAFAVVNKALFAEPLLCGGDSAGGHAQQMVLVRDIALYSLCEHHLLPFHGAVHVAYVPGPDGIVLGLSKVSRLVEVFARRLQLQERLGCQIADAVMAVCGARGAAVRIEARHMCMEMRGVQKHGAATITTVFSGILESDASMQSQFLSSLR